VTIVIPAIASLPFGGWRRRCLPGIVTSRSAYPELVMTITLVGREDRRKSRVPPKASREAPGRRRGNNAIAENNLSITSHRL